MLAFLTLKPNLKSLRILIWIKVKLKWWNNFNVRHAIITFKQRPSLLFLIQNYKSKTSKVNCNKSETVTTSKFLKYRRKRLKLIHNIYILFNFIKHKSLVGKVV